MTQRLRLNVDAVDDEIRDRGPGARIELQRDTADTFAAPTLLPTIPLVAGQEAYEVFDGAGTPDHWYRFRLTSSSGTLPSAYSDPFRGGSVESYATVESLREYLPMPDDSQDNLLADLLLDASRYLDAEIGRDFRRHPGVSGTEVRLVTAKPRMPTSSGYIPPAAAVLPVKAGLTSLTQVRVATVTGGSFTTIPSTAWYLHPTEPAPEDNYAGVALNGTGWDSWYEAINGVELTGVFGFESVPRAISKATLDLAREWYRQGPGGGGPVGVNQFGTPIFGGGLPLSVKEAIGLYRRTAGVH